MIKINIFLRITPSLASLHYFLTVKIYRYIIVFITFKQLVYEENNICRLLSLYSAKISYEDTIIYRLFDSMIIVILIFNND